MITESMKKGIFPPTLTLVKHMESEISTILNNIYKDLQKISNLSVFIMTKQICYKFYLLYPYEMRAPQYIVPAAFLLSSRIIDENNRFIKSLKSALESINDDSELSLVLVADEIKFQKGSMQKIQSSNRF